MGSKTPAFWLIVAFGSGVTLSSLGWLGWWSYQSVHFNAPPEARAAACPINNVSRYPMAATGLTGSISMEESILPRSIPPPGTVESPPAPDGGGDTPTPGNIRELPPAFEMAELPLNDPSDRADLSESPPEPALEDEPPIPEPVENPPVSDPVPNHPLAP